MDQGKEVGFKSSFSLRAIQPTDKVHSFSDESPSFLPDETQNLYDEAHSVCLTKLKVCMTKHTVFLTKHTAVCLTKTNLNYEAHSLPNHVTYKNTQTQSPPDYQINASQRQKT